MKLQLTLTAMSVTAALALAMFGAIFTPAMAAEHEHEHEHEAVNEHDHGLEVAVTNASDVATMKVLIQLLTQLLAALEEKAEMQKMDMDHVHDNSHEHSAEHESDSAADGLSITVETHADKTHVHVYHSDGTTGTFFVDASIDDHDAVYEAIAAETGLDHGEVVAATTFESDEDEEESGHEHEHMSSDEVDESYAGMDGLDGIHIMADGTVMLGNGEALSDATINDEGVIVLGDGTEVEPVMDMR